MTPFLKKMNDFVLCCRYVKTANSVVLDYAVSIQVQSFTHN